MQINLPDYIQSVPCLKFQATTEKEASSSFRPSNQISSSWWYDHRNTYCCKVSCFTSVARQYVLPTRNLFALHINKQLCSPAIMFQQTKKNWTKHQIHGAFYIQKNLVHQVYIFIVLSTYLYIQVGLTTLEASLCWVQAPWHRHVFNYITKTILLMKKNLMLHISTYFFN